VHALLARQLRRAGLAGDAVPDLAAWQAFLARVDKAYSDADLDRYTMERSLEVSSAEMRTLYTELATIVRSLSDALLVTNEHGRVTLTNPAAQQLLRWSDAECRGQSIGDVLRRIAPARARELFGAAAASGRDTFLQRRDGSEFAASITTSVVERDGQRCGEVYLLRDVTERLRFEEELIRVRDQAEAANRTKSEFLANMSHEIRTPMNGVIGTTSLLLDTALSAEQRDYVETIRSSGDLLLSILNDILDLAKIEAGKVELDLHPFDPHTAVEDTLDLFSGSAERRRLEVVCDLGDDVPRCCIGDLTRVRQVLSNLLANAIKFTEVGEVVMEARAEDVDADTVNLTFAVRDTGVGIPRERLARLFQPFEQADASITRRFGGSGLGLAISRLLVERMGGRMQVESEAGRGSRFWFTVPLQRGQAPVENPDPRAPFGRGRRVLLVDDNQTNLVVVAGQIRNFGFDVVTASSAAAALVELRAKGPFAAAVLDHMMPDEDGISLARRLRDGDAPSLPMLLLGSGPATPMGDLFGAVLRKPCLPRLLRESLRRLVDGDAKGAAPVRRAIPRLADERALRILIAEDVAVNQKLAVRMLEKLGYLADCVGNGIEAVEALRRKQYDVVLMDCMMPEMDGMQATRIIRSDSAVHQPWIIAVTANAMAGERERCLEAGMDDFVTKPIRVDAVIDALRAVPVG
jgi:PAS domain S-box-containing protein